MYKVIELFDDMQDNCHRYNVGDTYPRDGYKPSNERIKELSGCDNVRRAPLIEADTKKPVRKRVKSDGDTQ